MNIKVVAFTVSEKSINTYVYQGVSGYNVVNYYMNVYPTLTSSADTDGMTHSVTLHLDLHRLSSYPFTRLHHEKSWSTQN